MTRRRQAQVRHVPLVTLVVLFVCSLVGAAATAVGVSEARARTAETTGQVLESGDTIRDRHGQRRCKDATVAFPADEPRFTYTGLVRSACPQDGGPTTTPIYYDPDSPANAETATGSIALTGFMLLGIAGTLFCAGLLATRTWAAASRRRPGARAA